ncbi:hypothetical protein GLYMA_16G078600v4 [Glycine max]|uniref:Uncharacterized protein n=1 Tax=Glycine max TaxID=3847 RepID=A0A0R0FVQ0_SOYBN|nr:hypothetical protein GLYMA_16G078600v4 [Glycine max]
MQIFRTSVTTTIVMKLMITRELDTTTLNPIRVMQDPYPGVTQIHTCIFVPLAPTIVREGILDQQIWFDGGGWI